MTYDLNLKLRIIYLYLDNIELTYDNISYIFGCSVRSIKRWIQIYKNTNELKTTIRKYISYKVTQEQVEFIIEEINKKNNITIKDLHINFCKKFPNNIISKSHITNIIKDNNITRKKATLVHLSKR